MARRTASLAAGLLALVAAVQGHLGGSRQRLGRLAVSRLLESGNPKLEVARDVAQGLMDVGLDPRGSGLGDAIGQVDQRVPGHQRRGARREP